MTPSGLMLLISKINLQEDSLKKNEFVKSLNVSRETLNGFYEYEAYCLNGMRNKPSFKTYIGGYMAKTFFRLRSNYKNVEASGKRWVDVGSG